MRDYLYGDVEMEQESLGIWEFRLHRRVPVLRPVTYVDARFGETGGMMLNLSPGGAFIEGPVVPLASEIDLEFALFDRNTVRAKAVVRHLSLGAGMGVEFERLSAEQRQQITRFIDSF